MNIAYQRILEVSYCLKGTNLEVGVENLVSTQRLSHRMQTYSRAFT